MDQPNEQDQPKGPDIKVVDCEAPGGVSQVYANNVVLSWTNFDVNKRLSHNQRIVGDIPTNRLEHRATVTLAWSEAKALALMLTPLIQKFEELNGTINVDIKLP